MEKARLPQLRNQSIFGGLLMPVPVQALVMRDYCQRNGLTYKLHINENIFPNSYIILEGLPEELNIYEGIWRHLCS